MIRRPPRTTRTEPRLPYTTSSDLLEQTGDVALESVTGVDQRFELSVGQHPFVDYTGRQLRNVRRPRCGNRAHGDRFHQSGRMRGCTGNGDAAWPTRQVHPHRLTGRYGFSNDGEADIESAERLGGPADRGRKPGSVRKTAEQDGAGKGWCTVWCGDG